MAEMRTTSCKTAPNSDVQAMLKDTEISSITYSCTMYSTKANEDEQIIEKRVQTNIT